jgi:hypothetical protein
MKFVPYYELNVPNIIVDGASNTQTILTLSHWPKSHTPSELKEDLSAQIVFHYLDQPRFHVDVEAVSNNHFDEDGLVGLFAILNPEKANYWRELLIDIAAAGDFGTYQFPEAARIAFTIAAFADKEKSPFPREIFRQDYSQTTAALYIEMLKLLPEIISNPEKFRRMWKPQEEDLQSSETAIRTGAIRIEEFPSIDLAIVTVPPEIVECHPLALHNATSRFRILTMKGHQYEFRYRYESWVEYVSKPVMGRVDLDSLVESLNTEEQNGTWKFDGRDDITPRLSLEEKAESSISPEIFRTRLVEFLQNAI